MARAFRRDRRAPSAARPDVISRDGFVLVIDGDPRPELARRGIVLHPSVGALPLPVREPVAVRSVHIESALAGSDVVTAMTGDLHRRALARVGAARRVREWVGVALEAARDAVAEADDAGRPMRAGEPAPPLRLAGQIWPLEERGGPASAPDFAAAAAEHRVHAGTLAEAGVGLLRIERMETVGESEAATLAARETGLETWTSIALHADGRTLASGESLATWLSVVVPLAPTAVLLEAPTWAAATAGLREAGRILDSLDASGSVALGVALPPGPPVAQVGNDGGAAMDVAPPRRNDDDDDGRCAAAGNDDGRCAAAGNDAHRRRGRDPVGRNRRVAIPRRAAAVGRGSRSGGPSAHARRETGPAGGVGRAGRRARGARPCAVGRERTARGRRNGPACRPATRVEPEPRAASARPLRMGRRGWPCPRPAARRAVPARDRRRRGRPRRRRPGDAHRTGGRRARARSVAPRGGRGRRGRSAGRRANRGPRAGAALGGRHPDLAGPSPSLSGGGRSGALRRAPGAPTWRRPGTADPLEATCARRSAAPALSGPWLTGPSSP